MYDNVLNEKTLEDMLSSSTVANMLRFKEFFLSKIRTKSERQIIPLLCKGYAEADIVEELGISRQRINIVLHEYRKRLSPEQKWDLFSVIRESKSCRTL